MCQALCYAQVSCRQAEWIFHWGTAAFTRHLALYSAVQFLLFLSQSNKGPGVCRIFLSVSKWDLFLSTLGHHDKDVSSLQENVIWQTLGKEKLLCFASWVTHLPRLSKVVAWWQNGFIGDKGTSHQSFLSSKHWKFPFTWVAEMSASKVINFLSKQPGLWTGDYNRALSLSWIGTLWKLQFWLSLNKSALCYLGINTSKCIETGKSALPTPLGGIKNVSSTVTPFRMLRRPKRRNKQDPIFETILKKIVPRSKYTNFA